jgi:hypothetical protein
MEWKDSDGDARTYIDVNCCTHAHSESLRTHNYAQLFQHNSMEHTSYATISVHEMNRTETL